MAARKKIQQIFEDDDLQLNFQTSCNTTILGIDTGTSKYTAGFFILLGNQVLSRGTLDASALGLKGIGEAVRRLLQRHGVEVVVIEDYVYMAFRGYHTRFSDSKRANVMIGYLQAICDIEETEFEVIAPASWKATVSRYFARNLGIFEPSKNISEVIETECLPPKILTASTKAALQRSSHWKEAAGLCIYRLVRDEVRQQDDFYKQQPKRMSAQLKRFRKLKARSYSLQQASKRLRRELSRHLKSRRKRKSA